MKICEQCNGTGSYMDRATERMVRCGICNGSGKVAPKSSLGPPTNGEEEREQVVATDREADLERALRNCYMLARRRVGRGTDSSFDWHQVIRFCEEAGLKASPLREAEVKE
jgi:hypothetical protein